MRLRRDVWFNCLIMLNAAVVLDSLTVEEKQLFPSLAKVPEDAIDPRLAIVSRKIVLYHNFFRSNIQPKASNMLLMSWHPEAARLAQKYADKCVYHNHSRSEERTVPDLGGCGENLFASELKSPWFLVLKSWFLENNKFTYGDSRSDLGTVGHYTQMVWATSRVVGCGVAHCASGAPWGSFYNYVCHYCPSGNIENIVQYPYKAGESCADCPGDCVGGKLCTNWCPQKDYFSNCAQLAVNPGVCQLGCCNATCTCAGKIYKNYPWTG